MSNEVHLFTGQNVHPPGGILTNDPSATGHQGWLTDQLRGKRVWCSISINCLYISEERDSPVVKQVILLPGCSVRRLELKPADHQDQPLNGITRHFMTRSRSRLDKFHFVLEQSISGQQFLFGVTTLCECDQWQAVLGKACSFLVNSNVSNGQQIREFSPWKNQLKRVCSEPRVSAVGALDKPSDQCPHFIAVPSGTNNILPVQCGHKTIDLLQSDQENSDLVQSDRGNKDLVQSDRGNTDPVQFDQEKIDLVQSERGNTDPVQFDQEKKYLVQSDRGNTDLVQFDQEKIDLVQSDRVNTDPVKLDQERIDLIQSDRRNTDPVQFDEEKIDLVQPDRGNIDPVQLDQGKIDLVQSDQEIIDLEHSFHEKTASVQTGYENTELVQYDYKNIDLKQCDHKTKDPDKRQLVHSYLEKADLVQSGPEKTKPAQLQEQTCLVPCEYHKTDMVQSDHHKKDLVQSKFQKTDLGMPDHQKTDLVQSNHKNTDLVQSDHEKTDMTQSGHHKTDVGMSDFERTDLVQSDHQKTDLVRYDHQKTDLVQSDHQKTDLVQSDYEKTDLVQSDHQKTNMVQSDHQKTDMGHSDHQKTDLVESDFQKTDLGQSYKEKTELAQSDPEKEDLLQLRKEMACVLDRVPRMVEDKPDNSRITSQPLKTKRDAHDSSNTETTWSNNQSKPRQARSVDRLKSFPGKVLRRLTRSASTGIRRKFQSLTSQHTERSTAYPGRTHDADSSDLHLEIHKKHFFGSKFSQTEKSPHEISHSNRHSFSFPRLDAQLFGDSAFYKDAYSKSAVTTRLKDLKEVLLSGHLLCRTGSKLGRVYCVLSRAHLYIFASTRPDSLPERTVALRQCAVTYVSEIHERSRHLFTFRICPAGRDSICLSADNQQTMLEWMTVMQTAAVGVQPGCDLVSESGESKQDFDVRSTCGVCSQSDRDGKFGTDQACPHMDVPDTDTGQGVVENEDVRELYENYHLSVKGRLPTSCINATENTVEQFTSRDSAKQLVTTSTLTDVLDLFTKYNEPLNYHKLRSSRFVDMGKNLTQKDNRETRLENGVSDYLRSCPQHVTSFQTSSARTSKGFKEANTQNVQMSEPDVCSSSLQNVRDEKMARQTISQQLHNMSRPGLDHRTNQNRVSESRDELTQSLLDESKGDYIPSDQLILVHHNSMKQAWATTNPCLQEDVNRSLQQQNPRETRQAGLSPEYHDVCIVEDDWNLADTQMVTLPGLSQPSVDVKLKGLFTEGETVDMETNLMDSSQQTIDSSQTSLDISQAVSSGATRHAPSVDTVRHEAGQTVRQTNAVTEEQLLGSVQQKSLDAVRQKSLSETLRRKWQPKTMQAARNEAKAQIEVSPGRRSLPPDVDVDHVCLLTKLLQRRISTQLQLNAVHSQMMAHRGSPKERNKLFQIGKKRADVVQESTETNRHASELEEQERVLSLQLQELDKCLAVFDSPSPVAQSKGDNPRLRHSYDQALLRNFRLNSEAGATSSSSFSRNHEKLKDKVSQLYRSLSLKSSLQKFAQKTFPRASWQRNKKSTRQDDDKTTVKLQPPRTNRLPGVVSSVTDVSGKELAGIFNRPISSNTSAHSESTSVGAALPEKHQDEHNMHEKNSPAMSPSVARLPGHIRMSSSLTNLDRCANDLRMSPSLTYLGRNTHNIQMSASSSALNKLSVRQGDSVPSRIDYNSSLSRQMKGDLQDTSMACSRIQADLLDTSMASSRIQEDLQDASMASSRIQGDLQDTSTALSQMKRDLLDTPVTTRQRKGDLLENVALPAKLFPRDSASIDSDKEFSTASRSLSSKSQDNGVSEPTILRGQDNISTEPDKRQVSSSALAEIQAFEELLEKCLGSDPCNK